MNRDSYDLVVYVYDPTKPVYIFECDSLDSAKIAAGELCESLKGRNLSHIFIESQKNPGREFCQNVFHVNLS